MLYLIANYVLFQVYAFTVVFGISHDPRPQGLRGATPRQGLRGATPRQGLRGARGATLALFP